MNIYAGLILCGAAALYLASWLQSMLRKPEDRSGVWGVELTPDRIMGAALALHTLFLFVHAATQHRCPTTYSYEAIIFLCWCIALVYYFVSFSFTVPWLAKYVTPIIVALFVVAFVGMLSVPAAHDVEKGWRIKLHVVSLLLAYSFFLVSFISGVLYLFKEKAMKLQRPSHRLPPLELLDKVNLWTLVIGFPIMTFGLFVGLLLAQANPKLGSWMLEKKVIFVTVSWAMYGIVLHLRLMSHYRGRRVIILTVVSFCFLLLSLIGTQWHYFK
ncbi:MAG: cytochrome c biogenesis protein CcsA [Elusimicrobiota bacterium]